MKEVPLTDIFQRYFPSNNLKKTGSRWTAPCPLHQEKTGSFVIFPENRFKCFGCQAYGDAITLLTQAYGVRPIEAARMICQDFGIAVHNPQRPMTLKTRNEADQKAAKVQRERLLQESFKAKIWNVYSNLALLHRAILRSLRTFEDYESLSGMVHILPLLEEILDGLQSNNEIEQIEVLRYVRGWMEWATTLQNC